MEKNKFHFSKTEIKHIACAFIALAIAFSFVLYRKEIFSNGFNYNPIFLVNALVAVGFGFVLHELGHKFVAQKKGLWAEFRVWPAGLLLAIGMAVLSKGAFVFAAPGAVMISPVQKHRFGYSMALLKEDDIGKISIAGTVINLILASIFSLIFAFTGWQLAIITAQVNAWLAIFNLLPFGMLDGYKVWMWKKSIWGLAMLASVGLFWLTVVL